MMGFLLTLLTSILAGSFIGMERQWQKKLAGVRTMALVSLGATMFVRLSLLTEGDSSPTRIAAQVVSGIGFLAGGVIIRQGFTVTGINTAATLWCSAAVGTLIGASYLVEGVICAALIALTNILLRSLSRRVDSLTEGLSPEERFYYVSIICASELEIQARTKIIQLMNQLHLNVSKLSFTDIAENETDIYLVIEGQTINPLTINLFLEKVSVEEGILAVQLLQEEPSEKI